MKMVAGIWTRMESAWNLRVYLHLLLGVNSIRLRRRSYFAGKLEKTER